MSESQILAFESELKHKLQFKASSRLSTDAVLFKAFKFYDLYNNGYLSRTDFFKAIAKCGVVADTHDIDSLYRHYDPQNEGKIEYRTFIERLLFSSSSQDQSELSRSHISTKKQDHQSHQPEPNENFLGQRKNEKPQELSPSDKLKQSHYHKEPNTFQQVMDIISMQLRGDGICGLLNFANQLKSTDNQKTHLINGDKLYAFVKYLSNKSVSMVIQQFNPNKFGQVNYAQVIYGLKGNMNLQRQSRIDDLFNMLDTDQKGQIDIQNLIGGYRNKSQIGVFKRSIDLYCKFQSIDDGVFTDEDFNDFFEFISFSFTSDLSFNQFVRIGFYSQEPPRSTASSQRSRRQFEMKKENSNFQVNKPEAPGADFRKNKVQETKKEASSRDHFEQQDLSDHKSQFSAQSKRTDKGLVQMPQVKEINMIFLRMKKTLALKGTRGFLQFQKLLKASDTDNDGFVNLDQFRQVIKQQKIDITPIQAIQVFGIFDPQKHGLIDFQEVLHTLKGETPINRKKLIQRMWDKVKVDEDHTTFSKLKQSLNFRNHPDIQNGRKYDDQIWNEIQQTLLMIQDFSGSTRSDTIYDDVFEEYCENLSLSIPEDQLFESIAQTFWKIGSMTKIQDQYAGSRKVFDPKKSAYLQDHHRYAYNGGSVSQNAPFGTYNVPTDYKTEHNRL